MRAAALVLAVLAAGCSREEIDRWNREAAAAEAQRVAEYEAREAAARAPRVVAGKVVVTRLINPDLYLLVTEDGYTCPTTPATYAVTPIGATVTCGDFWGWRK